MGKKGQGGSNLLEFQKKIKICPPSSHIMIYREIVKWSGADAWDPVLSSPSKLFQLWHEITVFIV